MMLWFTLTDVPAIVAEPARSAVPELRATTTVTVPFPLPLVGLTAMNDAVLPAVQSAGLHPAGETDRRLERSALAEDGVEGCRGDGERAPFLGDELLVRVRASRHASGDGGNGAGPDASTAAAAARRRGR
jgi:hypothetical protein